MEIHEMLENHNFVLTEAAIIESLRRSGGITLHPRLENALLIYDGTGQSAITNLYQSFITVAHKGVLPIIICTPTWRANHDRISEAGVINDVNGDAVRFLKRLRNGWKAWAANIFIGFQANASSLDQTELDGAGTLQTDKLSDWGNRMIVLNRRFGVKILGGCCGTNRKHLQYLVNNINSEQEI